MPISDPFRELILTGMRAQRRTRPDQYLKNPINSGAGVDRGNIAPGVNPNPNDCPAVGYAAIIAESRRYCSVLGGPNVQVAFQRASPQRDG